MEEAVHADQSGASSCKIQALTLTGKGTWPNSVIHSVSQLAHYSVQGDSFRRLS